MTSRARPIAACRCSMPSPALYRPVSSGPDSCTSTMSIGRRPVATRLLTSEILAGTTLLAPRAKNRRPALAPPNAVTVTLVWSTANAWLNVSAKNTRKGGQRSAWASSMRVRSTGSAVASAQPTVSPARISWVKSSASGAIVIGVFTRLLALSSRQRWVELHEPGVASHLIASSALSRSHHQQRKEYDSSEPFPIPGQMAPFTLPRRPA